MRRLSILLSFLMCVMVAPPAAALDVRGPDTHYTHASWNSEDGLPGNQIFAVAQDQDGYLWLGTNETLVRFDGVRFVRCDALGYPPLPATGVRSLHIARNGAIWVGLDGSGGVSRLLNGHLTNFTPSDGIPR